LKQESSGCEVLNGHTKEERDDNNAPSPPIGPGVKLHLTPFELEGLWNLIGKLESLPSHKKCVPSGIHNAAALLHDIRVRIHTHSLLGFCFLEMVVQMHLLPVLFVKLYHKIFYKCDLPTYMRFRMLLEFVNFRFCCYKLHSHRRFVTACRQCLAVRSPVGVPTIGCLVKCMNDSHGCYSMFSFSCKKTDSFSTTFVAKD